MLLEPLIWFNNSVFPIVSCVQILMLQFRSEGIIPPKIFIWSTHQWHYTNDEHIHCRAVRRTRSCPVCLFHSPVMIRFHPLHKSLSLVWPLCETVGSGPGYSSGSREGISDVLWKQRLWGSELCLQMWFAIQTPRLTSWKRHVCAPISVTFSLMKLMCLTSMLGIWAKTEFQRKLLWAFHSTPVRGMALETKNSSRAVIGVNLTFQ